MPDSLLQRFIKGAFFTSSGRLVTTILGFASLMIYARWIPEEDYGSFVLLQVIIGFGISFSSLGINTAITKYIASTEDQNERQVLMSSAVLFNLSTLILASTIILIFKNTWFQLLGSVLNSEFIIFIPILLLIEGLLGNFTVILSGQFNFKMGGLIDLTMSTVSFVVTVILVIWLGMGVMGLVWARVISRGLALALSFLAVKMRFIFQVNFKKLKDMLLFSLPLFANYILDFLFTRADTILIGILLGSADIAIYEYARKIPESINMMYDAFRTVYFSFIVKSYASGEKEKVAAILNTSNRLMTFFGAIGTLIAFGFGALIFKFLFSERYLASVPAFGVLMIALTFLVLDSNLGYTLVGIGESNKPVFINFLRAIVSFAGYFLLIPVLGIVGAAAAGLIGTIIANPINVFFLRRKEIPVSMSAYFKPTLILIVMLAISLILQSYGMLVYVAAIILFIIVSILASVITRGDWANLMRESGNLLILFRKRFASKTT